MATTKFLLQQPYKKSIGQNRVLNPKETRLYLFLIIDRNHIVKVKTEHVILPKEWDFRNQGKKEILAGSIEFNRKLKKLKDDLKAKYEQTVDQYPDLPFEAISNILKEYGKHLEIPMLNNQKNFFQVFDEFKASLEGENTYRTIQKFGTVKKSLQSFCKENKKYENLSFSQIDHSFKDAFTMYLRSQKARGRQKSRPEGMQDGLLNDTIGKYIENLKTFCRWAEERGYNKRSTYKEFSNFTKANRKRKKQGNEIVTLTLPELRQFYAFNFSDSPTLDHVRDLFCFAAYTGQRWSDIEKFEKTQLQDDIWSFTAYKTKKVTEIDLIGFAAPALDILKKYNYELPKISLVKFNLYIKEAARLAGITEETKISRFVGAKEIEITKLKCDFIGSHTARKSCVSILLNNYNLNITHVLEITGHSDLKTLQKYIDKDRKARREAIAKTSRIDEPFKVKHKAS
jgi:integrase